MKFRAEEYFRAGTERMREARNIYNNGESFALAMYCGGLAVECLLRAFRWNKDQTFEGRHDLNDLLRASALLRIDEEHLRRKSIAEDEVRENATLLRSAMNEVVALWHNNLRYASESSLRAFLIRIDRVQGIRGNPLKKNAGVLLNAAQTVVDRGVLLWRSKTK